MYVSLYVGIKWYVPILTGETMGQETFLINMYVPYHFCQQRNNNYTFITRNVFGTYFFYLAYNIKKELDPETVT